MALKLAIQLDHWNELQDILTDDMENTLFNEVSKWLEKNYLIPVMNNRTPSKSVLPKVVQVELRINLNVILSYTNEFSKGVTVDLIPGYIVLTSRKEINNGSKGSERKREIQNFRTGRFIK